MRNFKKIFIWSFVLIVCLLLIIPTVRLFAAEITTDTYSYTVSGHYSGCVDAGVCYDFNSPYPECRGGTYGYWRYYSCHEHSGIWCTNHPQGMAGHTAYSYSVSGTKYVCTYASSVKKWSDCKIGDTSSYAESFNYSTRDVASASDPSCVDVVATRSCPSYSQNLTATCSSNVATANADIESVTWTAYPSGGAKNPDGSDSYTYNWTGTDALSGTTKFISKIYGVIGLKYATTTITSGSADYGNLESITVGCTNSIGGSGRSVNITKDGRCHPSTNNQKFLVKPMANLCLSTAGNSSIVETVDLSDPWTINKVWSWQCFGSGTGAVPADCSASFKSTDESLTCSLSMTNPLNATRVNVNTNTTWLASSTPAGTAIWKIEDANGTTTPSGTGNTLNKIFTTIGVKTVTAKLSSTTRDVYGLPCTATTTVVQTGGTAQEI